MDEGRYALIIACSEYQDHSLKELLKPGKDARALNAVLSHPNIGNFDVKILINKEAHIVNQEIETFLNDRKPGDTVLLYFSCHGIKDEDGQLFFASTNTNLGLLGSTTTSANFVNNAMLRSRSKSQILLLDCCYSGAFSKGMIAKSDERAVTKDQFQGKGRIILTASDSMQYSFEGDELSERWENSFSFFTGLVIYGLQTGEADKDNDGKISSNELYEYVYDKITDRTPNQRPQKWSFVEGDLIIAKNPYMPLKPPMVGDIHSIKQHKQQPIPVPSIPHKRQTLFYVKQLFQNKKISLSLIVISFAILSIGYYILIFLLLLLQIRLIMLLLLQIRLIMLLLLQIRLIMLLLLQRRHIFS